MNKDSIRANIKLILFSIFFSIVMGEIFIRVFEYYQYVKPSNKSQFQAYKDIYSDRRDKDYVFEHKKNIKVKLEKGYYDFIISTNSEGLREKKDYNSIEKSVIFLGDSIIEGASVENDEVLDEIFEKNTGVVSLNFGIGSSNTVHEFHYLNDKYKESYNTKLIVLGFCLNDFPQNISTRYFDPSLGNWLLYKYNNQDKVRKSTLTLWQHTKEFIKESKLAMFVLNSLGKIKDKESVSNPPYAYSDVNEEEAFYTELYINKINEFSKQIDSNFVVVIFPQESQLDYKYKPNERMQDLLIKILNKNNIKYIDLFELMKSNYKNEPNTRWYHDNTHPYVEGHRLYGEYLSQELPLMFPDVFNK